MGRPKNTEENMHTTVRVPAFLCKLFNIYCGESIEHFIKYCVYDPSDDLLDNNYSTSIQLTLPKKQYEELRKRCEGPSSQFFRDAIVQQIINSIYAEKGEK